MKISPFTPLFFIDRRSDGIESEYMQVFATSDEVFIQVIGGTSPPKGYIYHHDTDLKYNNIVWIKYQLNPTTAIWNVKLKLPAGCYYVTVGELQSEPFTVTGDEEVLKDTALIKYANRDNRRREDGVFVMSQMQHFFSFRVHGGFKDNGWSFECDTEQFTAQNGELEQLYACESTVKTFTMGTSSGVPVWYADRLNLILTCADVYVDGVKYGRADGAVPEIEQVSEGVNSFVVTQQLQRSGHEELNIGDISLRAIDTDLFRSIDEILRSL